MIHHTAQSRLTWAEDTALLRSNRSAVPGVGVKTGPDQVRSDRVRPGRYPTSHQHHREKPVWQDARLSPARSPLPLANANRSEFQFTLNQDTRGSEVVIQWCYSGSKTEAF
jgi:hypothetical protein